MSDANALNARQATEPDQDPGGADTPPAIARILRLVRKLIDYGKQFAATIQERAAAPGFAYFARPFGTADLAVILARITNGLRRAAALEARLCARAARGQDLGVAPVHLPAQPARQTAPPQAPPALQPAERTQDPCLAHLPTEEEIAAEVRRKPIGAVIIDICCDLGIAPGHLDRAFWDEINHAIIMYGGSLVRFIKDLHARVWAFPSRGPADDQYPGWPGPPLSPATATGPP